MKRALLVVLLLPVLAACASIPTPEARRAHADGLAAAQDWQRETLSAGRFDLVAYLPRKPAPGETLTLYLEGDGFAWLNGTTPSADPTPRDPLALRLALAHPAGNAAYLARPCQFVMAKPEDCPQRYWTGQRFAADVVDAMDAAVDRIKRRFGAARIILVGYSGGGNIAALLAGRRRDVIRLVTVAGNLDHAAWTRHHRVSALAHSLNAADAAEALRGLPQRHFLGGRDRVVPPSLARGWPAALGGDALANLRVIPDFDHVCCWADRWRELLHEP